MHKLIYGFQVVGLLEKQVKCYCVDMEKNKVFCLNETKTENVFSILCESSKENERYLFYCYEDVL